MKKTPEDIRQLEERISELKSRETESRRDKPESEFSFAAKTGFRIGIELLSGVLVGAALGHVLDKVFGTRPWLLVGFMFLGGAAGVLNVYRFAKNEEKSRQKE